jgi:hypothetical protein
MAADAPEVHLNGADLAPRNEAHCYGDAPGFADDCGGQASRLLRHIDGSGHLRFRCCVTCRFRTCASGNLTFLSNVWPTPFRVHRRRDDRPCGGALEKACFARAGFALKGPCRYDTRGPGSPALCVGSRHPETA